jgi:hypothetical protein
MIDQFPFRELTTAAGIAAAALLIRQVIEAAKGSFLPWLDDNNERKGTFILAALLYIAWLAVYGTDLAKDGPAALAAFWACSIAALGTNEAVDAAKGVVAKNVVQTVQTDEVVAQEAVASGMTSGVTAATGSTGAAAAAGAAAGAVAGAAAGVVAAGSVGVPGPDADASGADAAGADGEDPDSPAPLEEGPDVDLNANGGDRPRLTVRGARRSRRIASAPVRPSQASARGRRGPGRARTRTRSRSRSPAASPRPR